MKKPDVSLENYQAVYDYYQDYRPNPRLARLGHAAMNQVYKPEVHYEEGAVQSITNLLAHNWRLAILPNHRLGIDQYHIAAMAHQEPLLQPLQSNTFILTKHQLFQNALLRRGIDIMGAVPTFRNPGSDATTEPVREIAHITSEEEEGFRKAAHERMFAVSRSRLIEGQHLALFPEGKRFDNNPREIHKIRSGIGHIVCGLGTVRVALVPVGVSYGNANQNNRRPHLYIANPITERFSSPEEVVNRLQIDLQFAVNNAVDISDDRAAA